MGVGLRLGLGQLRLELRDLARELFLGLGVLGVDQVRKEMW